MAKHFDIPLCKTIEEAQEFIKKINESIKNSECIYWGIAFKNETALIGTICLWQISEEELKAEIGFELLPKFQGIGLMREAVPVVLNYGFSEMNLQSIEGEVAPENIKSIKLMENFGFTKTPDIRKTDSDAVKEHKTFMYELRNNNWKGRIL
jgi:ribosomal-protein-alanine N-acetyltransferase